MNIHLKGVFFLTQTLLPLIADGGRLVNLSSGLARFSLPGYAAYGAMKGAVEVLTRYLAKELGPRYRREHYRPRGDRDRLRRRRGARQQTGQRLYRERNGARPPRPAR